jgi:YVTN family beta-propeller protein
VVVNEGADQTFDITPNAGFHVADVLVDGVSVGAVTSHTFTNVTANHTIDASFAVTTFTITATAGANGSIAPSGAVVVNEGADQTFDITPNAGFHVADVLVDGVSVGAVTSHTFTNVTANHTIDATFAQTTYTITATAGGNGSIAPSGPVVVNEGANQTFDITPNAGFHVADVLVDGVSVGAVTSHTFTNVTANHTIDATFAQTTYTITATAGANGSIAPSGAVIVNEGADQSFTITANAGFHVADVLVDGVSVGAVTSHTFTNVTANHTIDASFAANPTFTITATAGPNGSISPSGPVIVNEGADQTFTITANSGFHVADVLVDGVSVGAVTSHTFTNVTANHTINASFAITTFTITATSGPNGSISPSGAVVVNEGANQTFTITPDPSYHVAGVLVDGGSAGQVTSFTFTNVTANHTIHAAFAITTVHSSPIDLTPDGLEGWVVNPDHGTVSVFGTQGGNENQLLAEVPVGKEPWCVDVHPTNGEVWVTSFREDKVYIVDRASRSVITTIPTAFETFGVCFNPAGTVALVTATGADKVQAIDVATRTITHTMNVYRRPRGIAWKSDGTRAWVSHLLMPEFLGRMTIVFPDTWTTSSPIINQVFGTDNAGYPSTMQNLTVAPAPADTVLWIPNNMINTTAGQINGNPLTPTNIFHACIRPVNIKIASGTDLPNNTYFMSNLGTPVGGPIAVDFKGTKAFVANLHSENVTVLNAANILSPTQITVIPAGKGPIGIVTHPTMNRAYVANWLSRNVTVINTGANNVVTTFSSVTSEVIPPQILHGKQLFYTSKAPLSLDGRGACASCHVFDRNDARPWDLSEFGKHIRSTPDIRGIGFTGPHDWTADKDEMQDHNFGILDFTGGAGLIPSPNPPLGAPNRGLSQDMDDMSLYMSSLVPRRGSPFRNPNGTQTAEADSGEAIFNNPAVGCATCHVPPFYTDSHLQENPFIKHIVGTADPDDDDGAAGFDTPTLVNLWDSGPYLHHHQANTLMQVLTTFNPGDQHGVTSTLTTQQKDWLIAFLQQIVWPESTGTSVDAPAVASASAKTSFENIFPNPFRSETSLKFSLANTPSKVRIDVVDVTGRRVRTLLNREMTQGVHIVGWDSKNDEGQLVAAGMYFAKLNVDGQVQQTKRLTVLR